MPLVPMAQLLSDARRAGYAVCYCESWNLESTQAVIEAAEELESPISVGFNGGFLIHQGRSKPENLAYYAGFKLAASKSPVPIAFLLNETDSLPQIEEAIELGFNSIMVESPHMNKDQYRDLVKTVVKLAHDHDLFVEGQVGELPEGWEGGSPDSEITDPAVASAFVQETGVDALSVSIGNTHVLTRGRSPVYLDKVEKIREAVDVPLVIHGGSGFPSEYASDVIKLGVAKFNFGTALKQTYLDAIRTKLSEYHEPMNPHVYLGMGGEKDIMVAGMEAVKAKVKELLKTYGYAGRNRIINNAIV
jgi:ketose-bisphosphate aldolase